MPSHPDIDLNETHALFPSGEWEGFYTYTFGPEAGRHPMYFILRFKNKGVTGSGGDDVGPFSWRGMYDTGQLLCRMTKYYATHTVFYDGQVDENGIWGTWTIGEYMHGGFHIWPKNSAENKAEAEIEKATDKIIIKVSSVIAYGLAQAPVFAPVYTAERGLRIIPAASQPHPRPLPNGEGRRDKHRRVRCGTLYVSPPCWGGVGGGVDSRRELCVAHARR